MDVPEQAWRQVQAWVESLIKEKEAAERWLTAEQVAEEYCFASPEAWGQFVKRNPELRAFRSDGKWDKEGIETWMRAHPERRRPRRQLKLL